MSLSRRVQISLGERTYADLELLAGRAELTIHTEARLLLQWGIELAKRRWAALTESDEMPTSNPTIDAGWEQPTLPMIEPTPGELDRAMRDLRAFSEAHPDNGPSGMIVTLPPKPD